MTTMKITGCFQGAIDKKFGMCSGYCDWPGNRGREELNMSQVQTSQYYASNENSGGDIAYAKVDGGRCRNLRWMGGIT